MKENNWREEIQAVLWGNSFIRIRKARGAVRSRGVYIFMGENYSIFIQMGNTQER